MKLTVKQLIAKLAKLDQNARVLLSIADPNDTAYTNYILDVTVDTDGVTIEGWVASDNKKAFAPWAHD